MQPAPTSPSPAAPLDALPARRTAEHYVILGLVTLAFLLEVAFALYVEPDPRGYGTHQKLGLPPCLPMELWHVPCPGCGVTTSVALASHGRLAASFLNQPLGFLLACAVPFAFLAAWFLHLRGRDLRAMARRVPTWGVASYGVAIVVLSWAYKLALVRGWIG